MQNLLHARIVFLEDWLQQLNNSLTSQASSPAEHTQAQAQIDIIVRALEHYRNAFELERGLRASEPPMHSQG